MDALALLPWRFAPALATALLHALWQDTLLALVAALALAALSQRHAATRHAVAMGVLSAMVLVPAATFVRGLSKRGTRNCCGRPARKGKPGMNPMQATVYSAEECNATISSGVRDV